MKRENISNRITDFFQREKGKLIAYVNRLIDDAAYYDAEDILQDVMISMFTRPEGTIENISAYMYQSLRNRAVDSLRKRKNMQSIQENVFSDNNLTLEGLLAVLRYDTWSEFEKNEFRKTLYSAIDSLSDEQKAIIIATEFEDHSFNDLSNEWDIPMGILWMTGQSIKLTTMQSSGMKKERPPLMSI